MNIPLERIGSVCRERYQAEQRLIVYCSDEECPRQRPGGQEAGSVRFSAGAGVRRRQEGLGRRRTAAGNRRLTGTRGVAAPRRDAAEHRLGELRSAALGRGWIRGQSAHPHPQHRPAGGTGGVVRGTHTARPRCARPHARAGSPASIRTPTGSSSTAPARRIQNAIWPPRYPPSGISSSRTGTPAATPASGTSAATKGRSTASPTSGPASATSTTRASPVRSSTTSTTWASPIPTRWTRRGYSATARRCRWACSPTRASSAAPGRWTARWSFWSRSTSGRSCCWSGSRIPIRP